MKFENNENKVKVTNAGISQKFSISDDSAVMVIDSLINLYTNPIGSLVRELVSNAVDANRERELKLSGELELDEEDVLENFSKKSQYVEVNYKEGNKLLNVEHCISIKDWGNGLSPERVANVFTVLGTSTKRITDKLIGGYGIGAKSAFSYTDTFYVKAIHNKVERMYMLFKGNALPEMTLVHENVSDECNSTEVIIPLKSYYDKEDFKNAVKEQLLFFSSVKFLGFGEEFNSPKSIYESEDLIVPDSSGSTNYLKCIVGRVIYPLDFSLLEGINRDQYRIDAYIRFKIGEVDLIPSRENLRYTDKTIDSIRNKLANVKSQAEIELAKRLEGEKDFLIWFNSMGNMASYSRNLYNTPDNKVANGLGALIQLAEYNNSPKVISAILKKNWPKLPENTFEIIANGGQLIGLEVKKLVSYYAKQFKSNRQRLEVISTAEFIKSLVQSNEKTFNMYEVEEKYSGLKTAALHKTHDFKFLCFKKHGPIGKVANASGGIQITDEEREKVGNYIVECLEKNYSQYIKPYKDIDISDIKPEEDINVDLQEFRKLNETVFYKELTRHNYPNDKTIAGLNFKNQAEGIKVSELTKVVQDGGKVIYGYSNDDNLLRMVGGILHSTKPAANLSSSSFNNNVSKGYTVIKISKKHSKQFTQFTYVNDFFMDKHKELIEYCTFHKIKDSMMVLKDSVMLINFGIVNEEINKVWVKIYEKFKKYDSYRHNIRNQHQLHEAIIALCTEKGIYDTDLVDSIEALVAYLKSIPLYEIIRSRDGRAPELTQKQADELKEILIFKDIKLAECPYYTEIQNELPVLEEKED